MGIACPFFLIFAQMYAYRHWLRDYVPSGFHLSSHTRDQALSAIDGGVMTIAIAVKVDDGIVLASDSAATFGWTDQSTGSYHVNQIYNNATKIFKLHKDLPLGAVAWGLGSIGRSSLKILAKDFRKELAANSNFHQDNYCVEQVAHLFKEFMCDRHYQTNFSSVAEKDKPQIGFMVAGYSTGAPRGEVWRLELIKGVCFGPEKAFDMDTSGFRWDGMPLALRRLVLGFDPIGLTQVLQDAGLAADKVNEIIERCRLAFGFSLVNDSMPIQDAIDLATFLEKTAAQYTRFCDGPDSVGGPAEVAVLTKYEGFKWIIRKHFYDQKLNP